MFLPPRYIVVDDNPEHLGAILNAFQELGAPCLGITYKPDEDLDGGLFKGVRVLFLDLHLIEQVLNSDDSQRFAHIAQILEDNISKDGGPFILVVWTEHAHEVEQLVNYLNDPQSLSPHARPLSISGLSKTKFINLDTGKSRDVEKLRTEVMSIMKESPQLAALGAWEREVSGASGATLAALTGLVPESYRNTSSYAEGLGDALGRLASAAVGEQHVTSDPRAAISASLAPMLVDRIINQESATGDSQLWQQALRVPGEGTRATTDQIGRINRMLHLAVPESETILATDWGAVVEFPFALDNEELDRKFGVSVGELLGEEFKIGRRDRDRCPVRLVRVGAVCDHAQNRRGPIPYLLGVEIPSDIERKLGSSGVLRVPDSEWTSPLLMIDADERAFVLTVNSRYSVSVPRGETEKWVPVYRLREQLLMHLISHSNSYVGRPGIIQLRDDPD